MRRLIFAAFVAAMLWGFSPNAALAQGCGPQNPNCVVPTAPFGTSNNQAASTAFVQGAVSSNAIIVGTTVVTGGTSNCLLYDNAGAVGCLATANSSILGTNGSGVPGWQTSLACSFLPALTGDVTSSLGGCATTIAAGSVTNAKLANMAAHTVKCNTSGSAGSAADCTAAQVNGVTNPSNFNVVTNCNADNTGGVDSTSAFNTCIALAYTFVNNVPSYGLTHSGTCAYVPPGIYLISSVNMTEQTNACLWANPSTVILYGNQQVTSGKPMIDMTACSACTLHGLNIFGMNTNGTVPSVLPTAGILLADDSVGGHSNKNKVDFVGIQGFFSNPAIYVFGSTDNEFNFSTSENSHCGAGALFISSVNDYAITSPYATISAVTPTTSDNAFYSQELHDCGTSETVASLQIHNAFSTRFHGGLNDSSAIAGDAAHVKFSGSGNTSETWLGTQFYSEHGQSATHLFNGNGSAVDGFTVIGSDLNNHNGYSGSFFTGTGTYSNVNIGGNTPTITTLQPTPSSCGTSPSVFATNSNNNFGAIREGSTATGCTVTFSYAWGAAPNCVVSSSSALSSLTIATSTTAITLTHGSATNVVVTYRCDGP